MGIMVTGSRKVLQRYIVAGVAVTTALTVSRPDLLTKVYAAANIHDWTKLEDLNLYGGIYTSAAMSATGTHIILGTQDGGENSGEDLSPLYISQDSGATWENVAEEIDPGIRHRWTAVDVSDNGQVMVAVSDESWDEVDESGAAGKVFVSEDGGDTWNLSSIMGSDDWKDAVVSGDGSKIVLAKQDSGNLTVSEDNGDSWNNVLVDDGEYEAVNLKSVSISDDGEKMLVGGENGSSAYTNIYVTTDSGATWSDVSPNPSDSNFNNNHDMSEDGSTMLASTFGWDGDGIDGIFISENNGADWTREDPNDAGVNYWADTTVSDDGSVLATLNEEGAMYISSDLGQNWTEEDPGQEYEDTNYWVALDTNHDGTAFIVVSEEHAYITSSTSPSSPTVTLDDAEGGKTITLTTPSGTTITCHSAVKESGLAAQDVAYTYPLGLVDFCFSGAGENNLVSLIFVTDLKPNEITVRKYNPTNKTYTTVTEASVTETTLEGKRALLVSYNIADNGPLDTDPDTGEIADPVGIAVLGVTAPNTGLEKQ